MRGRSVVWSVVVVGVLVAGAAVADGVVRERTQETLSTSLHTGIVGLDSAPDVTIGGFPFLTQVLAGQLDDVTVTAPAATLDGLRLQQVDVHLTGVSTSQPTVARSARLTAVASVADIEAALAVPVDLAIQGDALVTSATVLGLALDVVLEPRPAGRAIEVDVAGLSLAGVSVPTDELPAALRDQLTGLRIPVDGLPQGMELTEVEVQPDGVRLTAEGTDVVFDTTS
ncbi:DUF2993 domain-containing protein [Cellulomonas sp. KRMCY2]|uniref:LmeA family phospholipid-binding protein n=1 Tax=Cellulomonas sp. KRMCY2 TaxID=1304865 RepID=UPI00045E9E6C|nr:DUF2993 domain-containing protein [Cellulomonas sp. KRMCY2]